MSLIEKIKNLFRSEASIKEQEKLPVDAKISEQQI
jgi:hypothetical protein